MIDLYEACPLALNFVFGLGHPRPSLIRDCSDISLRLFLIGGYQTLYGFAAREDSGLTRAIQICICIGTW